MGDNIEERKKIALAMGWVKKDYGYWSSPRSDSGIAHHGLSDEELPNPFTDANDDYAVNDAGLTHPDENFRRVYLAATNQPMNTYCIGDFAGGYLAALRAIQ